jgi:hypothetical protein
LKLIEVNNGNKRTFAEVRDRDVELLSHLAWRMEDGEAITDLQDIYQLRVSMDFVINNPNVIYGSHGTT